MINQKFGKLTIIKFIKKENNNNYYECFCECDLRELIVL